MVKVRKICVYMSIGSQRPTCLRKRGQRFCGLYILPVGIGDQAWIDIYRWIEWNVASIKRVLLVVLLGNATVLVVFQRKGF